jgi:hypothetical protein
LMLSSSVRSSPSPSSVFTPFFSSFFFAIAILPATPLAFRCKFWAQRATGCEPYENGVKKNGLLLPLVVGRGRLQPGFRSLRPAARQWGWLLPAVPPVQATPTQPTAGLPRPAPQAGFTADPRLVFPLVPPRLSISFQGRERGGGCDREPRMNSLPPPQVANQIPLGA